MGTEHQRLDALYKNVLYAIATRLPDVHSTSADLSPVLNQALDGILKASRDYTKFTHGLVLQYDRQGGSVELAGLSGRARRAWQIAKGFRPALEESLANVRETDSLVLRDMLIQRRPLIAEISHKSTRVFGYSGKGGEFRHERGTRFPRTIRDIVLEWQNKLLFAQRGDPEAALQSSLSLWAPLVAPVAYPEIDEGLSARPPGIARLHFVIGLAFPSPAPRPNDVVLLDPQQRVELEALLRLSEALGTLLSLPENWRRLWSEYAETIASERLLRGLITTATLFIGVRHQLLSAARQLNHKVKALNELVPQAEEEWGRASSRGGRPALTHAQLASEIKGVGWLTDLLHRTVGDLWSYSVDVVSLGVHETTRQELDDMVKELAFLLGIAVIGGSHETLTGAEPEWYIASRFVELPASLPIPKHVMRLLLFVLMQNAREAVQAHPDGPINTGVPHTDVTALEWDIQLVADCSDNRNLVLEVTDRGIGMTDETKDQVGLGPHSTKDDGAHSGLGLYMVHRLVSELDGSLQLLDGPGARGARVRISIPLPP